MLTRPALRALLRQHLPTDTLLHGFLGQNFPAVEQRLTAGMDRVRKENVVLEQLADEPRFSALLQGLG